MGPRFQERQNRTQIRDKYQRTDKAAFEETAEAIASTANHSFDLEWELKTKGNTQTLSLKANKLLDLRNYFMHAD